MNKRVVFVVAASLVAGLVVVFIIMGTQRGQSSLKGRHQIHDQQMSAIPTDVQSSTQHVANQSKKVGELTVVFRSTDSSEKARSEALGKLYALRMEMTDEELQGLWVALLDVAKEQGLNAQFHSDELWVLNEIGLLLKHKGILSSAEIEEQLGFLVDLSADDEQNLSVRRMAITVLGDLQVANAVPMLSELLGDEQNWNTPELARSASIALSRLDPKQAFKPVANILSNTTNSAVFGSVAYSLREIELPEVLAVLTENRYRLKDNLSVDNAITELFPVVTNVLANPSSPHISSAIDATKSIWQEDHFGGATNANPNATCSNGVNAVWEAYIAGIDPTDPNVAFLTSILPGEILQWSCVSGRVYSVWWTTNLLNDFQPLETNLPWTQGSYTNSDAPPCSYYKINVQLEE